MKKAIICDLDGTISNTERRAQQAMSVSTFKSAAWWDAFFQSEWVKLDRPIGFSQVALNAYKDDGYAIIYLSGRRNTLKKATGQWLQQWGYPKGHLILRPKGMKTKKFKRGVVRIVRRKGFDVESAFDNDTGMVKMFREQKIPEVVQIKTNSSKSWKEILRGLHLPVTVDKWLGFRGSRKFPSWQDAVRWMRKNPELRIKNKLKSIRKCVHCGHVSYSKLRKCPSCGAPMG